jgi:hypothetical protein
MAGTACRRWPPGRTASRSNVALAVAVPAGVSPELRITGLPAEAVATWTAP